MVKRGEKDVIVVCSNGDEGRVYLVIVYCVPCTFPLFHNKRQL